MAGGAKSFASPAARAIVTGVAAALALAGGAVAPVAQSADSTGRIGPSLFTTTNGRVLSPAGRVTVLGNFPTGGALTPDGRFYWAIDSGLGHNDVRIVSVRTGGIVQTLPLPGAYGGVAFAPDGRTAYVSGEPAGDVPPAGETKGDEGDVVHVFGVSRRTGKAVEGEPIPLPASDSGGLAWPQGLAVTPNGARLAVALNEASALALVDLETLETKRVAVGDSPARVAIAPDGATAYVSSEGDGTVDVVDLESDELVDRIEVGARAGMATAHPSGLALDPSGRRLYVALSSRDEVVVIDAKSLAVLRYVKVGRSAAIGAQPVDVAVSPRGDRLYVANSGEDAVAVVALRPGAGASPFSVIGRIPTAAYPTAVAVTPDSRRVVWIAAKGLGAGPNQGYEQYAFNDALYGTYTPTALVGRLGVLERPEGLALRRLSRRAQRTIANVGERTAPPGSPVVGPGGGASDKIKYVFYVVRENRVYDQIFGTDPRGDGDPRLELFDDNGVEGPTGGVTPNAHKLAQIFPLLDHVYSSSEVSVDGHLITSGAFAIDYVQRGLHANYGNRGRAGRFDEPIAYPPRYFLFDEAARKGVTFRNYGETAVGAEDEGRETFDEVEQGTSPAYQQIASDAGSTAGDVGGAPASHFDTFNAEFTAQLAQGAVPQFNYLTLPLDHTFGTTPGLPTPKALVANNDLGLGQIVERISKSPIWPETAIFVVEDDAQDGADHVDAHRMPAFVISPWARRRAVVSTRYDTYSVIRTIELILGLDALSLNDALATPMFDAFDTTADVESTRYESVAPEHSLAELNGADAPFARLSKAMPFDELDVVPEAILDRILWASVHGKDSPAPAPGPNGSPAERARAVGAMRVYRRGGDVRAWLLRHGDEDD